MQLIFESETDALSVAEQLYNVERVGNILITDSIDFAALELAASLAQVNFPAFSFPIVSNLKCRLPFPRHQRECTDENTPKIYVACLSAYNAGHVWKYLGASNQRQYEHCWMNRRDAAVAEQRGRQWEFDPEPEPELADW
ncbi:hypothetical protein ACE1AT_23710 [Pelatocladus sp. BLCC-F211]|uniref:hypothetical protein n=1 Tax=Pelatocladus sp. BLCC-F211 TaxID=3342752 RepID=UPI0035B7A596